MPWKRISRWAGLGALPGLAFLTLAVPVEPEIDLLLGLGGILLAVTGALAAGLAAAAPEPSQRRRTLLRAGAAALLGFVVFFVQPVLGIVVALVGVLVGARWEDAGRSILSRTG